MELLHRPEKMDSHPVRDRNHHLSWIRLNRLSYIGLSLATVLDTVNPQGYIVCFLFRHNSHMFLFESRAIGDPS